MRMSDAIITILGAAGTVLKNTREDNKRLAAEAATSAAEMKKWREKKEWEALNLPTLKAVGESKVPIDLKIGNAQSDALVEGSVMPLKVNNEMMAEYYKFKGLGTKIQDEHGEDKKFMGLDGKMRTMTYGQFQAQAQGTQEAMNLVANFNAKKKLGYTDAIAENDLMYAVKQKLAENGLNFKGTNEQLLVRLEGFLEQEAKDKKALELEHHKQLKLLEREQAEIDKHNTKMQAYQDLSDGNLFAARDMFPQNSLVQQDLSRQQLEENPLIRNNLGKILRAVESHTAGNTKLLRLHPEALKIHNTVANKAEGKFMKINPIFNYYQLKNITKPEDISFAMQQLINIPDEVYNHKTFTQNKTALNLQVSQLVLQATGQSLDMLFGKDKLTPNDYLKTAIDFKKLGLLSENHPDWLNTAIENITGKQLTDVKNSKSNSNKQTQVVMSNTNDVDGTPDGKITISEISSNGLPSDSSIERVYVYEDEENLKDKEANRVRIQKDVALASAVMNKSPEQVVSIIDQGNVLNTQAVAVSKNILYVRNNSMEGYNYTEISDDIAANDPVAMKKFRRNTTALALTHGPVTNVDQEHGLQVNSYAFHIRKGELLAYGINKKVAFEKITGTKVPDTDPPFQIDLQRKNKDYVLRGENLNKVIKENMFADIKELNNAKRMGQNSLQVSNLLLENFDLVDRIAINRGEQLDFGTAMIRTPLGANLAMAVDGIKSSIQDVTNILGLGGESKLFSFLNTNIGDSDILTRGSINNEQLTAALTEDVTGMLKSIDTQIATEVDPTKIRNLEKNKKMMLKLVSDHADFVKGLDAGQYSNAQIQNVATRKMLHAALVFYTAAAFQGEGGKAISDGDRKFVEWALGYKTFTNIAQRKAAIMGMMKIVGKTTAINELITSGDPRLMYVGLHYNKYFGMNTLSALDLQRVPDFVQQAYAGNIQEAIDKNEITFNQGTYWLGKGNSVPENSIEEQESSSYLAGTNDIRALTPFQTFTYYGQEIRNAMTEENFNSVMTTAAQLSLKRADDRNKQVFNLLMQQYPTLFENWKGQPLTKQIAENYGINNWTGFKLSFEKDV